jgi:predicted phage tail protein
MATEFESQTAPKVETHAEMVRGVVRSLRGAIKTKKAKLKEFEDLGNPLMVDAARREIEELESELAEVIANNPGVIKMEPVAVEAASTTRLDSVSRAMVVSALMLSGTALLGVVLVMGAPWYYAGMLFSLAAYLVWQHCF